MARPRSVAGDKVRGQDGDAQTHSFPVGHDYLARTLRRMADGKNLETPPEQRVGRVGHLDLVKFARSWVLEGGIMLLGRSTASRMSS
jgi:hypothetical protein